MLEFQSVSINKNLLFYISPLYFSLILLKIPLGYDPYKSLLKFYEFLFN